MGNCCTLASSSMDWAGEDWGSVTSKHNNKSSSSKVFDEVHHHHGVKVNNLGNVEKERLLGLGITSSDVNNGKVKIMISKKDLAELLGEKHSIDTGRTGHASAEQVLVGLINAKVHHLNDAHHRPWRPVLHSIPELN